MEENIIIEENMIVVRDPKTFCFNFDLPKDVDKNWKPEIEFIIKSNKSLAKIIIKNEIEQLLLKYEHGKLVTKIRLKKFR